MFDLFQVVYNAKKLQEIDSLLLICIVSGNYLKEGHQYAQKRVITGNIHLI